MRPSSEESFDGRGDPDPTRRLRRGIRGAATPQNRGSWRIHLNYASRYDRGAWDRDGEECVS